MKIDNFIEVVNECNRFYSKKNWMHITDYTDIIKSINAENRIQKKNRKTNEKNTTKKGESKQGGEKESSWKEETTQETVETVL